MDIDEFRATAIATLRTSVGWQTKIARRLGVEPRTVRRWIKSGVCPEWLPQKMAEMINLTDNTPWPRAEWMVGTGTLECGTVTRLVAHIQPPRFVGRVVYCDPTGAPLSEEEPADVGSGVVYVVDGTDQEGDVVICEIAWIDTPQPGEVTMLMDAAADAFEAWET